MVVLAAAGGTAQAATNNIGTVQSGVGKCFDTYIGVTVPLINPAPVQYGQTPLFGTPSQTVRWRANLDQFISGQWVQIRQGTWFIGTAYGSHDYGLTQPTWRSLAGDPLPSPLGFDRLPAGTAQAPVYFKVWYEFFWYSDAYRGEGRAWAWAFGHQEYRGGGGFGSPVTDQTMYAWCKYPGRNYLL